MCFTIFDCVLNSEISFRQPLKEMEKQLKEKKLFSHVFEDGGGAGGPITPSSPLPPTPEPRPTKVPF